MGPKAWVTVLLSAIVLTGVGAYFFSQDLSRHRAAFEDAIAARAGISVSLDGPIRLVARPAGLEVQAEDVAFGVREAVAQRLTLSLPWSLVVDPKAPARAVTLSDLRIKSSGGLTSFLQARAGEDLRLPEQGIRVDKVTVDFLPLRLTTLKKLTLTDLTITSTAVDLPSGGAGSLADDTPGAQPLARGTFKLPTDETPWRGAVDFFSRPGGSDYGHPVLFSLRQDEAVVTVDTTLFGAAERVLPVNFKLRLPEPAAAKAAVPLLQALEGELRLEGSVGLGQDTVLLTRVEGTLGKGDFSATGLFSEKPLPDLQLTVNSRLFDASAIALPALGDVWAQVKPQLEPVLFGDGAFPVRLTLDGLAGGVLYDDRLLDAFSLSFEMKESRARLDHLSLGAGRSELIAAGELLRGEASALNIAFESQNFFQGGGEGSGARSATPVVIGGEFASRGADFAGLLAALTGQVDLSSGAGLVFPEALEILAPGLPGALVEMGLGRAGGPFVIQCGLMSMRFERGEGRTALAMARLASGSLSADARFDLPKGSISALLSPRPWDPAKLGSLADIEIRGPLDGPEVQFANSTPQRGGLPGFEVMLNGGEGLSEALPLIDPLVLKTNRCTEGLQFAVPEPGAMRSSGRQIDQIFRQRPRRSPESLLPATEPPTQ